MLVKAFMRLAETEYFTGLARTTCPKYERTLAPENSPCENLS